MGRIQTDRIGKKVIVLFFVTLLVVLISSCNLFFSAPHGRENINDSNAQITAFTAVPSSDNSVVTMWNWRGPKDGSSDDRITEIHIQHSIFGYPENNIFFVGETFTDKNIWQYEWPDLDFGETHYFSLFAKIDDGDDSEIWLAPLKAKTKLPGTAETVVSYSKIDAFNIDNVGAVTPNPDPLAVENDEWAVVYFDLPEDVFIVNASINISLGALTEITFAPLDGFLPNDDGEKWDWLQNGLIVNEAASITFNASSASYTITDVVRAAVMGPEKAILIKTTDGSSIGITNNALTPWITADIIK